MVASACPQNIFLNLGTGDLPARAQQAKPGKTPQDLGWTQVGFFDRVVTIPGIRSEVNAIKSELPASADIYICAESRPVSKYHPYGFEARFWIARTPVGFANGATCSKI